MVYYSKTRKGPGLLCNENRQYAQVSSQGHAPTDLTLGKAPPKLINMMLCGTHIQSETLEKREFSHP